jgi:hypothetical protein
VLGGTYHSSQTVTVGNVRSDVVMHYTTSGQVPTESDPTVAVGGQIAVDNPLTLRVRAWSSTLPPSSITSAIYVLQPATPTASPAPAMYTTPQTVSLATTTAGASIHYTTDGSDPDQSSPIYTGPFGVTGVVTVKARALRNGWIDGDVLSAQYTIELTPPVITAQTSPAPNAAGWYDGTITVTFICTDPESGITFCTAPQQVSGEGGSVQVTGTATNGAGVSSFLTVPLSIDKTAPYVSVWSPRNGETLPDSATSVSIRGGVGDLSGVDTVTCGTVSATVTGTTFACTVPVSPGSNQLHVAAQDRAGHVTTRDVLVDVGGAATSIEISPATITLVTGETRKIVVKDDRSRTVTSGTWSVDQPLIASVEASSSVIEVTGLAAGVATLTVTANGLTANATVTVLAGAGDGTSPFEDPSVVPAGTTLWSVSGTTLPPRANVLRAAPTADGDPADAPAMFFVDEGAQLVGTELMRLYNRPTSIAATTMDGRRLWEYRFTGATVSQVAADNQGGVVLVLPDDQPGSSEYNPGTIRRLDGRTGGVTWEYVVEGGAGSISEVAIHPDGTVYAFEEPYYGASVYLVGINPSGAVQRWQLPHSASAYRIASGPIVQEDGSVVLFSTEQWGEPEDKGSPRLITLRNGSLQVDEVQSGVLDFQYVNPRDFRLLPDGSGGLLWAHRTDAYVYHISSSLVVTWRRLLNEFNGSFLSTEYVLADDGAYAVVQAVNSSGSTPYWAKVLAFDPVTLQETSMPAMLGAARAEQSQLRLRFAVAGSGVYVSGPTESDQYAVNTGAFSFTSGGSVVQVFPGLWGAWGLQGQRDFVAGQKASIALTPWPYQAGSAQVGNAVTLVDIIEVSEENDRLVIALGGTNQSGTLRVEIAGQPGTFPLFETQNLSAGTHTFTNFGQTLINANLPGGTYSVIKATWLAGMSQRSANIVRCGDARDLARYEYDSYGVRDSSMAPPVKWRPFCEDFSQTRSSAYFAFAELNWGDYSWALIRQPLIIGATAGYGLDKWRQNYGLPMTVNSAYRNPAHNAATPGSAQNSRHMFGDAVDIRVPSQTVTEWQDIEDALEGAFPSFIEPQSGPCQLKCVHGDWRYVVGGYH